MAAIAFANEELLLWRPPAVFLTPLRPGCLITPPIGACLAQQEHLGQ